MKTEKLRSSWDWQCTNITSAGGRQRQRTPEASEAWAPGQPGRQCETPPQQTTGNWRRKGKEKKNCILLKQRGRGGEGERDGEEEKGKWERGVGGEKRGSRGGKGGGGGDYAYIFRAPQHFFPSTPFLLPTVSSFFGLAFYFTDSPFVCV